MELLVIACTMLIVMVIHTYVNPVKNDVDLLRRELIKDNYFGNDDIAKNF